MSLRRINPNGRPASVSSVQNTHQNKIAKLLFVAQPTQSLGTRRWRFQKPDASEFRLMVCKKAERIAHFIVALAIFSWICTATAYGFQDIAIKVAASTDDVFIGEGIDYVVEIQNAQNPAAPDMTAIKEWFDVVETGNQSRNQSQMTIINGRVTQSSTLSHVYQFRLTPKSAGELTIPSVRAKIDGQELKGNELQLRVRPVEKQDAVLVEIKSEQSKVYPTQPFTVTLRILVRPLPGNASGTDPLRPLKRNPPHIDINWVEVPAGLSSDDKSQWLQSMLVQARDGGGFALNELTARTGSLFGGERPALFDLSKGREVQLGFDGQPIDYFKYELTRAFTAEKTGTYAFGPATVKGVFVDGESVDELKGKKIIAIAPALSLEVIDVPTPRPASFCGGIGEYPWRSSASPTKLRIGDPLTLTLEVERGPFCGSLDLISAPDLTAIPKFDDDFDLIDKNPTGRVEGATKKFTYAMRPKRANVSIPGVSIASFDPRTEKFSEFLTKPIPLDVSEATRITAGDLVGTTSVTNSKEIKTRSEGIFQNITDPSQLRDERVDLGLWGKLTAGIWFTTGSLIAFVTLYRRKSSDTLWQRRQQARRTAIRKIADAREAFQRGDSKEAMRNVRASILGLVADTRGHVVEGLTTSEVDQVLSETAVTTDDRKAISKLLESIEAAEYAGNAPDPSTAITTAASLVARIAPVLERGK